MPVRPAIRDLLEQLHVPYTALAHQPAFTAQEEAAIAHPVVGDFGELPSAEKSTAHDGRGLWV